MDSQSFHRGEMCSRHSAAEELVESSVEEDAACDRAAFRIFRWEITAAELVLCSDLSTLAGMPKDTGLSTS